MQEKKITKVKFPERLRELLTARGWNQKELAEMAGVTPSAVTHWVKGKRGPGAEELSRVAEALGSTMDELYGGRRATQAQGAKGAQEKKPRNWGGPYYGTSDEAPVVSPVFAGSASAPEDAGHDAPRVKVNCQDPNCYCVVVWGDSMAPVYQAGDVLVIAPNSRVEINDLVVFKNEKDEPYFKKYLGQSGGVHRFASFNPNYPVMELRRGIVKMHPVHSVIRPLKGKIF